VAHMPAARAQFIAPGIDRPLKPASRGRLPLILGRQAFADMPRIGHGVVPANMDDRMVLKAREVEAAAVGPAPLRPLDGQPPFGSLPQFLVTYRGIGSDLGSERERPSEFFGSGPVTGLADKRGEL